jgi:hypothetical protein
MNPTNFLQIFVSLIEPILQVLFEKLAQKTCPTKLHRSKVPKI